MQHTRIHLDIEHRKIIGNRIVELRLAEPLRTLKPIIMQVISEFQEKYGILVPCKSAEHYMHNYNDVGWLDRISAAEESQKIMIMERARTLITEHPLTKHDAVRMALRELNIRNVTVSPATLHRWECATKIHIPRHMKVLECLDCGKSFSTKYLRDIPHIPYCPECRSTYVDSIFNACRWNKMDRAELLTYKSKMSTCSLCKGEYLHVGKSNRVLCDICNEIPIAYTYMFEFRSNLDIPQDILTVDQRREYIRKCAESIGSTRQCTECHQEFRVPLKGCSSDICSKCKRRRARSVYDSKTSMRKQLTNQYNLQQTLTVINKGLEDMPKSGSCNICNCDIDRSIGRKTCKECLHIYPQHHVVLLNKGELTRDELIEIHNTTMPIPCNSCGKLFSISPRTVTHKLCTTCIRSADAKLKPHTPDSASLTDDQRRELVKDIDALSCNTTPVADACKIVCDHIGIKVISVSTYMRWSKNMRNGLPPSTPHRTATKATCTCGSSCACTENTTEFDQINPSTMSIEELIAMLTKLKPAVDRLQCELQSRLSEVQTTIVDLGVSLPAN